MQESKRSRHADQSADQFGSARKDLLVLDEFEEKWGKNETKAELAAVRGEQGARVRVGHLLIMLLNSIIRLSLRRSPFLSILHKKL